MIQKYTYGTPFETDAIVTSIPTSEGTPAYGTISAENGFSFTYDMDDNDVVYGLGESNRGINKRGYVYESNCSDQPNHTEDKISLYGAHNFLVISGKQTFGLFVDYPGKLKFDIGYTLSSQLKITCEDADLYLYVIEGETPYDIVKQFRKIIGRSYIPPKFAFGFGQSRWGYKTEKDFKEFTSELKSRGMHLIVDGVFNHVGDDSIYFDRYGKYNTVGAYEYWSYVYDLMNNEEIEQEVAMTKADEYFVKSGQTFSKENILA